jgi:hypothetical protein
VSSGPKAQWIVEDDEPVTVAGQMRKSEFVRLVLEELTGSVSAADGRPLTSDNCPSFAFWTGFYASQNAAHIERALCSFIGEDPGVAAARDYVPLFAAEIARRVRKAAR